MINYVLNIINFVLNIINYVLNIINYVLNMINCTMYTWEDIHINSINVLQH